jgi:hypothetical protein
MANTYVALATVTVGSGGASSIDFTSIPQTYTDLIVKLSGRTLQTQVYGVVYMKFNGSTANQTAIRLYGGDGSAGSDNTVTAALLSGNNATASTFGTADIYIPNYTSSNFKSVSSDSVGETNGTSGIYVQLSANLWSSTSAITSLSFYGSNDFVQYTTATLYGIKNS